MGCVNKVMIFIFFNVCFFFLFNILLDFNIIFLLSYIVLMRGYGNFLVNLLNIIGNFFCSGIINFVDFFVIY